MATCVGYLLDQMRRLRQQAFTMARQAKQDNNQKKLIECLKMAGHAHGMVIACQAMLQYNGNNREGYFDYNLTQDCRYETNERVTNWIWLVYERYQFVGPKI